MDFLPSVIRAQYEGDFRIHFTFSDNVQGTVDLQSWLEGPIFEPLKDRSYFQRFFIDGGTIRVAERSGHHTGNVARGRQARRCRPTTRWSRCLRLSALLSAHRSVRETKDGGIR